MAVEVKWRMRKKY